MLNTSPFKTFKNEKSLSTCIPETLNGIPKAAAWDNFFAGLNMFSDDFISDGRNQPDPQEREDL